MELKYLTGATAGRPVVALSALNGAKKTDNTEEEEQNKGGFLGGIGYLGEKIGAGFMSSIEGIWDFAAGGIADLFGADEWAEQQMANDWFGDWYETAGEWYNPSEGWRVAGDVASGIGTSVPAILGIAAGALITYASGGAAAPLAAKIIAGSIAPALAGFAAAGNATKEAYRKTGELGGKEWGYGALVGATEAAIETVTAKIGAGSARAGKAIGKALLGETVEQAGKQAAKKGAMYIVGNTVKHIGKDFIGEAVEEGVAEIMAPVYARMTYDPDAKNATAEEVAYAAFVGGLSGVIMGGADPIVTGGVNAYKGKSAVKGGRASEILATAKMIAEAEAESPSGYDMLDRIRRDYEYIAKKGGEVDTPAARRKLGELERLTTATRFLPAVDSSAAAILNNPKAAAEVYGSMGLVDENGQRLEITAEKLTEGIDLEALKTMDGKKQRYALRRAISSNKLLMTLAVADTGGKLMLDAESYAGKAEQGALLGGRGAYQNFVATATPEQKAALAERFGIEGGLDATSYEDFVGYAERYSTTEEGAAYIDASRSAIRAARSTTANKKALPRVIGDTQKDGTYRYGDISIVKDGDTVRFYDHTTGNLSRAMTRGEANAVLQSERNAGEGRRQEVGKSEQSDSLSEESGSGDITVGMSDSERAAILRDKKIMVKPLEVTEASELDWNALEKNEKKTVEKALIQKMRDLGHLRTYKTDKIAVEFEFTGGGLRKSMNSQVSDYGGNLADLTKVVMNMQALLDTSVLIEIHKDKAKGTPKENQRLVQVYVLVSAYADGNSIVPVQFEVKQYVDDQNRLYLAVAMTKIEADVVGDTVLTEEERTRLLSTSTYSIPQLVEKINPSDENFFKYIPDEFLNADQKAAKERALAREAKKYGRDTRQALPETAASDKTDTSAPKAESTVREIEAWAKENVKKYGELLPNEKREIRAMVRQARTLGIPEADIRRYANLEARTHVRVSFSKNRCLSDTQEDGTKVYEDGFYDPNTNEIVVNPEGKRSAARLILHELSHSLYKGKYGKVIDKAVRRMDENRATEVDGRYAEYGAEIAFEEVSVHHAEDILGNERNLDRLLRDEPTLGDKILSFFRLARYGDDAKLSRAAGKLYRHFERALTIASARNTGGLTLETTSDGEGRRYAIRDDSPNAFNPEGKTLREQLREAMDTSESNERRYVYVGEFTQEFTEKLKKHIDIKKLPIVMNYRDAYLSMEAKERGKYQGERINYHNLGVDGLEAALLSFSDPEYVLLSTKAGRIELILQGRDYKNRQLFSIVEINTKAQGNRNFLDVHVVTSVYGNGGIKNRIRAAGEEGRLIYNKAEESTQGMPQVQYKRDINADSSTTSIPDSAEKNNPTTKNSSKNSSGRRAALPDGVAATATAVGRAPVSYEAGRLEKVFAAKDRLYMETVDEMYGAVKYLRKVGGMKKAEAEAAIQASRSAQNQAQAMIGSVQYNVFSENPEKMGDGLLEIYKPTRNWSAEKHNDLELFLLHSLNIDRMTLETRSRAWAAPLRQEVQKLESELATLKSDLARLKREKGKKQTAINNARVRHGVVKTAAAKARWQAKVAAFRSDLATLSKDIKTAEREISQKERALKTAEKEYKDALLENKPVFGQNEENGRDHDITAAESRELIKELKAKYGADFATIEAVAKDLYRYLDNLQEMRVAAGLISRETADRMKKLYPHYVPAYRAKDKTGAAPVKGKNAMEVSTTVRRAKGGSADIISVQESVARQTSELMRAGHINLLAGQIYDAAKASGDTTYVEIVSEEGATRTAEAEADVALDELDREVGTDAILRPKEGQITFYRDGKRITMKLSKELLYAFGAIRSPSVDFTNPLAKASAGANKTFKKLVTTWSPAFMLRNPIRDLQDAGLNSRHPALFAKFYASGSAAREILRNSRDWQLYRALGGFSSSVFDGVLKDASGYAGFEQVFGAFFEAKGDKSKLQKAWKKASAPVKALFAGVENVNAFLEQVTRFAEFKASLAAGDSPSVAINNSAEVTTNFGRRGRLTKIANATLMPFLNPAIQGFDKIFRNVSDIFAGEKTGKQIALGLSSLIAKALIIGMIPMIFNSLMYGDDEDYEQLREEDKENYFLVKIGDGNFIKIPRGRLAAVIGGLYNRGAKIAKGEDPDLAGYLENIKTNVTPVDNVARTIFSPIQDLVTNKTWYGGDIEGREFENVAPKDRYDESTSSIAVVIGSVFNYSPKKIHYLLDQYSGVIGDFVLPATSKKEHKDPFLGNFTLDSVTNNKYSEKFYSLYDETLYADTAGDEAAAYRLRYLNRVKKAVSDMNKEIDTIRQSDLTNAEKTKQVRVVRALINAAYDSALASVGTVDEAIEATKGFDTAALEAGYTADAAKDFRDAEVTRRVFGAECALRQYNKKVYEKYSLFHKAGIGYDELYEFYFSTRGVENDLDKQGNAIEGSRRGKILSAINALDLTKLQKILLLLSKGYAIKDGDIKGVTAEAGKKMVLRYLSQSKDLSKEERIALAEACGFTVKNGKIVVN